MGHKNKTITDLNDNDVDSVFDETKQQINQILDAAGVKTNIDTGEISRVKKSIQNSIEDIRSGKLTTSFDKYRILNFLKKEDIEANYLAELKEYFTGELKGFTAPNLLQKSCKTIFNLKDILLTIENYQVAIISSEAGCGKTSLTK